MKKRNIILSSIVSIALCLALIAGSTFAMFSDKETVSIAVTGGKIDLEAKILPAGLKAFSKSYDYDLSKYVETETAAVLDADVYKAPFTVAGDLLTGGIATATETTVTLDKMAPLDRVTFDIEISNQSDIDAAYRIYVVHTGDLYGALDIAFKHGEADAAANGYYYTSDSSAWTTIAHTETGVVETVPVEVIFPEGANDNDYQGKSCELTFVVEAYQAYAKLNTVEAGKRTWIVANQTGLNAVAGLCNEGDTIVLQGETWATVDFATENAIDVTMRGADIGTFNVNIPNGTIHVYNNVETVNGMNVDLAHSAHFYGEVGTLKATAGHFVIEKTATVEEIVAAPETAELKIEVKGAAEKVSTPDDDITAKITVQVAGTGSVKEVVIPVADTKIAVKVAAEATVEALKITDEDADAKITLVNKGTIENKAELEDKTQAPLPSVNGNTYATVAEAVGAAEAGAVVEIPESEGPIKVPNLSSNISLVGTLDSDGKPETKVSAEGSGSVASVPNGATFENLEFNFGGSSYHGFQHAGKITFKNCVLNGLFFSYGDMEFIDCTFNAPNGDYSMWLYGKDASFKGCTFNGYGKWFNVYCESNSEVYNISFEDCKFVNLGTSAKKAGVNIKDTCGTTKLKYNVTIKDCTTEGLFPAAAAQDGALLVIDPLVQVDDIKAGETFITVTLDGVSVFPAK